LLFNFSLIAGEEAFLIVANAGVAQTALDKKELRSLFTLKKRIWQDGTSVQLITLPPKHKSHKTFVRSQLKLFPYQVHRLWDRQVFSGSALNPKQADSYEEVIEMIANTEGAISYISASESELIKNDKVKILTIN
jgi:ABC-type phosphate transport system substrate-binding protein